MAKSFKRIINMEKAARLEGLGWRDAEIAKHLKLSPAGLAMVKQDPDYPTVRDRIKTGVCSELDEVMKDDANYVRERLRGMIPQALDGLFENAVQTKDARIRQAACTEILDRDGRLAKVQRIGLPTEDQGGVGASVDTEMADALSKALASVPTRNVTNAGIDGNPASNKVQ